MAKDREGLPAAIANKIYKTSQTRGASKSQIYQNRVLRNNTVLIPYTVLGSYRPLDEHEFESGYIVLIRPGEYFSSRPPAQADHVPDDLELAEDLLVFYRTRNEWEEYHPEQYGWEYATSRTPPLEGQYVARVPDTTKEEDTEIYQGFTGSDSGGQGAGIRAYEYASREIIEKTRYQLSYLAWRSEGVMELAESEGVEHPAGFKRHVDAYCEKNGLSNKVRLKEQHLIAHNSPICPLCRKLVSAEDLASSVQQAEGREVPDLTITAANMFHVEALVHGQFNHSVYNLGWGHHHCNVVASDEGVEATLDWMADVLQRNGYEVPSHADE